MTTIEVPPKSKRPPRPKVPPAGLHRAQAKAVNEKGAAFVVTWEFRAEARRWTIQQDCIPRQMGDILANLGFAGLAVEHTAVIGEDALILVRTRGGRTSAYVDEVKPIPRPPD